MLPAMLALLFLDHTRVVLEADSACCIKIQNYKLSTLRLKPKNGRIITDTQIPSPVHWLIRQRLALADAAFITNGFHLTRVERAEDCSVERAQHFLVVHRAASVFAVQRNQFFQGLSKSFV